MKSSLVILTFIFILAFSTIARADVISDRPGEISGTETSQSGGMIEISDRKMTEIGPVTTDVPQPDPTGGNVSQTATGGNASQTSGSQVTEIPVGPVIELPDQKGAVIKPAPETGDAGTEKQPVAETATGIKEQTSEEGSAAGTIRQIDKPTANDGTAGKTDTPAPAESTTETTTEGTEEETAVEPETVEVTAGPKAAGPGSQRVSLGFSVVSPNHNMGSQKLAIGSVELADGSWQALGYEASIHAPYYKLIRETVDSMGTAWYVVKYCGNRIGNSYTNDGTRAREFWLLKSDCVVRNYIDIESSNTTRGKIVAAALELLGSRYAYGGSGPDAFDCSGLVKYVMNKAGISVPRTSSELCAMSGKVDISKLRPGDICVRNGHAGIYIGNDVFVHASEATVGVVAEYLSNYNAINKFTTYINVVGD